MPRHFRIDPPAVISANGAPDTSLDGKCPDLSEHARIHGTCASPTGTEERQMPRHFRIDPPAVISANGAPDTSPDGKSPDLSEHARIHGTCASPTGTERSAWG